MTKLIEAKEFPDSIVWSTQVTLPYHQPAKVLSVRLPYYAARHAVVAQAEFKEF